MVHAEIETSIPPEKVWRAWAKAFELRGASLTEGAKASGIIRYKILKVEKGKSYSILWKSFLTKLVYTYTVTKIGSGSVIRVQAAPKGFFFWLVRLTLKKKIKSELDQFLKDFVSGILKYQS